jgi:hypothetical protein
MSLFTAAGCTGSPVYSTGAVAIANPAAGSVLSASTNQTTYAVTAGSTVYWMVSYHSTNPALIDSASCTEQTTVSFTGEDTIAAVPVP